MNKPTLYFITLKNTPIFKQLQLEEALLRTKKENFFIFNEGSTPAIVLGISGKVEELVHKENAASLSVPLIRRYSGGGTVIVDHNTLFTSFIMNKEDLDCSAYPEPIMKWTGSFYQNALSIDGFSLRENDYAIHNKKCAGNAQYLQKDRWLHHTTFLWDYDDHKMDCLLHPKKTPSYRDGRVHTDFLCKLKDHLSAKEAFYYSIYEELKKRFDVVELKHQNVLNADYPDHRKTTTFL